MFGLEDSLPIFLQVLWDFIHVRVSQQIPERRRPRVAAALEDESMLPAAAAGKVLNRSLRFISTPDRRTIILQGAAREALSDGALAAIHPDSITRHPVRLGS